MIDTNKWFVDALAFGNSIVESICQKANTIIPLSISQLRVLALFIWLLAGWLALKVTNKILEIVLIILLVFLIISTFLGI